MTRDGVVAYSRHQPDDHAPYDIVDICCEDLHVLDESLCKILFGRLKESCVFCQRKGGDASRTNSTAAMLTPGLAAASFSYPSWNFFFCSDLFVSR